MRIHSAWIYLALLGLTFSSNALANKTRVSWPVYRANAIKYYESRLPYAIVIYVYTSPDKLVGIINPRGRSDKKFMRKLGKTIVSQTFTRLTNAERTTIGLALGSFLLDQGYDTANMFSKKTKYTLLLTMPKVKPSDCAAYLEVENNFKKVINDSIQKKSNGQSPYSVVILELDSPKAKITCAK